MLGLSLAGAPLSAQATPAPPPGPEAEVPRLGPLPAFFHSLIIPGWAQSKLDRKLTASLFVAWEGVTLGMMLKAAGEVRYLRRVEADSGRIAGKESERQDWLFLLAFNHLFSGLEAFVGSQLRDFPADVKLRATSGGFGIEALVPFRIP